MQSNFWRLLIINNIEIVLKKKYLRSLVSTFSYDHKLIFELDNLTRGISKNPSEKAPIVTNLYEIVSTCEVPTEEIIESVLTNLAYFTSKTIINGANIATFKKLIDNDDNGYSLTLYLLSHEIPRVALPLLSVLLNLTRLGRLLIVQPYHYYELKHINPLTYEAFLKWIERIENDNKNTQKNPSPNNKLRSSPNLALTVL